MQFTIKPYNNISKEFLDNFLLRSKKEKPMHRDKAVPNKRKAKKKKDRLYMYCWPPAGWHY